MMGPEGPLPLGFYSAHLSPTERKYSVFKKELLGAFKSLRHFLPEVYGKHVTIYTDHLPLQMAFQTNNIPLNDPQAYRQITEIGRFTRDIRHVSGINNVFADYLSRIPEDKVGLAYLEDAPPEVANLEDAPPEVATTETVKMQVMTLDVILDLQQQCPEIKLIKSGDKPKMTSFQNIEFDGKSLFCEVSSSQARPYIPKGAREQIMTSLHCLDHIGIGASTKRIAGEYYWPSIKQDIKNFVKKCNSCMKVKPATKLVNTGKFNVPDKRFSHVMVDIVGPLPDSYGYKFLLTAICRTSRLFHAMPLREASASEVATAFLHHWASLFGIPSEMSSDNGASFIANLWRDMLDKLHVEVKYSALYRPQSIGMLERQHRGLKDSLKAAIQDMADKHESKWMDHLPFVLLGRKVAFQPDLGASASEMTFGTNVRIPGQILLDPGKLPDGPELQDILHKVRTNTNRETRHPPNHNPPEPPLPDIPADVTHVYTRQHHSTGLQSPYEGPFRIDERISRSVVKIEVGAYKDGRKRFEFRHLNDIKLAHPQSLAAPVTRPALGRPSSSSSSSSNACKDMSEQSGPDPQPPQNPVVSESKQNDAEDTGSVIEQTTGPPPGHPFLNRSSRSTRNPAPKYVDAMKWVSNQPWSASNEEIVALNASIAKAA